MTSGHHTVSGLTAHLYELFDIQQYKTKVSYYKQINIRPSIYSQKEVKLNIQK